MKRKIAIMLAAVMTTAMLPLNAMATTSNSVSKTVKVKNDNLIDGVNLKILPTSEIESGASIVINLDNAEFDVERIYELYHDGDSARSYDQALAYFESLTEYTAGKDDYDTVKNALNRSNGKEDGIIRVLANEMNTSSPTQQLPYKIVSVNDDSIEVVLVPVPDSIADKTNTDVSKEKPYFLIPIVAVSNGDDGDVVKVSIDDNEYGINTTESTIASIIGDDGSTTTTISDVNAGTDDIKIADITVKQTAKETFEAGQVKVRLNGGFKISSDSNIKIKAGTGLSGASTQTVSVDIDDSDSYFTFDIPAEWETLAKDSANVSFKITGLVVEADDEDKNWGDINLTISGNSAGITKETIKIGERVDYGFELSVTDEVPTIISGRTWLENDDLEDDDFESATVKFEETSKDTWITSRKLEFTVPEGVKIVDVEYDEVKKIDGSQSSLEDKTAISGKGTVLKINKGLEPKYKDNDSDGMNFEFNLYLSIDADFTGDVTLGVAGGGLAADTLEDVTIATAVAPISVETSTTSVNMGYQVFDAADITITEAQDGVLLDDKEVVISFDDKKFGNSELGFNDTDVEYSIDGELEIDEFEVYDGAITFDVDKTSYTEPSSITISNITVGTTRSVPYGSYDLKISGDAVVNNYKSKIDDVYDLKFEDIEKSDNEDRAYFDTTDGYSYDDYVKIITDTNTLDGVVEVTIGEKTIVVDGEPIEIDVAPYIQTSSNSTLVPLRFVSIALGVDSDKLEDADNSSKIAWDGNSKTATILYAAGNGQKIIQFQAGSNIMVVDGTSIPMENGVVAEITDNRMFVPFRALGQALGVPVDWDAETRTAIYNKR